GGRIFFRRRQRDRNDLPVILKRIHRAEARVEIVDRRNAAHALSDILVTAGHFHHLFEIFLREEVIVSVDTHEEDPPGTAPENIRFIWLSLAPLDGTRPVPCATASAPAVRKANCGPWSALPTGAPRCPQTGGGQGADCRIAARNPFHAAHRAR